MTGHQVFFIKRLLYVFCISMLGSVSLCVETEINLETIFPMLSYKKVIDTAMRIYSDLLILEKKHQRHEPFEELIDIIIGRMMRIQCYVKQLVHDYTVERTVSLDELEYLSHLFDYMEITSESFQTNQFPVLFNVWLSHLKNILTKDIEKHPL